jgi:hypothetical protein
LPRCPENRTSLTTNRLFAPGGVRPPAAPRVTVIGPQRIGPQRANPMLKYHGLRPLPSRFPLPLILYRLLYRLRHEVTGQSRSWL